LHQEIESGNSKIMLWSVEDGRCIMVSPQALFQNRIAKISVLNNTLFPGYLLCLFQEGGFQIINAYTMISLKTFKSNAKAIQTFSLSANHG